MTRPLRVAALVVAAGAAAGSLPWNGPFAWAGERLPVWFDIVAAFGCVAGAAHLVAEHARRFAAREAGWRGSAVVVVSFLFTLVAGLFKLGAPSWETGLLDGPTWFARLYEVGYAPALASLAALVPFLAAAALGRALRARARGAGLFFGAATVIVLGNVPLLDALASRLPAPLRDWLPSRMAAWTLAVPVAAGERALLAGVALGAAAAAGGLLLGRGGGVPLGER